MNKEPGMVVVGGGPAGCCLAALAADQGHVIQLLEATPFDAPPSAGMAQRTLALSHASWDTLAQLGITPSAVHAMPIRSIHVSYRGRPGRVELRAEDSDADRFGATVSYGALLGALRAQVRHRPLIHVADGCRVERVSGASSAARTDWRLPTGAVASRLSALAVIADGGALADDPATLRWRYAQQALACEVHTASPPGDCAWERFTREGPIALLPSAHGYALIWTGPPARIQRLLDLPEPAFLVELQEWFGDRAGRFLGATQRIPYPLSGRFALLPARRRVVRIANAAQAMHPVAGQGFNLGLRDVRALMTVVARHGESDPGGSTALAAYSAARARDRSLTAGMTHLLAGAFSLPLPGAAWPGSLALLGMDLSPALRRRFARLMAEGLPA